MSKKKDIGLESKIRYTPTTPESFDGSKKQFFLDDEAGMMDTPVYWPHMTRCPDCGRFMKRGLQNWARHIQENCPFFKKNKKPSGILRFAEANKHAYIGGVDPYGEDKNNISKSQYFLRFEIHPQQAFVMMDGNKSSKENHKKKKAINWWINTDWGNGIFWFRIFGKGLHFKNIRKRDLLFSERNGYHQRIQIGRLSIRMLKKIKP